MSMSIESGVSTSPLGEMPRPKTDVLEGNKALFSAYEGPAVRGKAPEIHVPRLDSMDTAIGKTAIWGSESSL